MIRPPKLKPKTDLNDKIHQYFMTNIKYTLILFGAVIVCVFPFISTFEETTSVNGSVDQAKQVISVDQVKRFIKGMAKDPQSVRFLEWGPALKIDNEHIIRCKFSATNSFGGRIAEDHLFSISKNGQVTFLYQTVAEWGLHSTEVIF